MTMHSSSSYAITEFQEWTTDKTRLHEQVNSSFKIISPGV